MKNSFDKSLSPFFYHFEDDRINDSEMFDTFGGIEQNESDENFDFEVIKTNTSKKNSVSFHSGLLGQLYNSFSQLSSKIFENLNHA